MARPLSRFLLVGPLVLGFAVAGGLPARAQDAQSPAAGSEQPAAKTVDCVDLIRIDRTEVLDDQTILFHMKGGKIWRNRLPYKCPQLGFEKSFSHKTSINRLCSVDTITVINTGARMPGATCGLGVFEEYTPPKKDAKGSKAKDGAGR